MKELSLVIAKKKKKKPPNQNLPGVMIPLSEEAGEKGGRSVRIGEPLNTALAQDQMSIAWL